MEDNGPSGDGPLTNVITGNQIAAVHVGGPAIILACTPQNSPHSNPPDTPPPRRSDERPLARRELFQAHEEEKIKTILNGPIQENTLNLCGDGIRTPSKEKWPELRICNIYTHSKNVKCSSSTEKADLHQLFSGKGFERAAARSNRGNGHFVVILGGPGSGKSTFVRRYGKMVLDKKIKEMKDITIVYFVNASELAMNEERTTFFELMFLKLVHGFDSVKDYAIDWLKNDDNQSKILFVIDGMHELQGMQLDKQRQLIGYNDAAEPAVIMYNFLRGRLMPKAKILAASRFHRIKNYHERIRPFTFKLAGFTREDSMFLFQEMIGPGGDTKWERLSESLKSLCSTPLWLNYVAYMHRTHPGSTLDKSALRIDDASSIFAHLLLNFYNRERWDENPERYAALKKFCLRKLRQGRGIFTESEVKRHHLAKEDIMNLCLSSPKEHPGVMELSRRKSYIWFSHMLIQESLACLGFLDLALPEFKDILKRHLQSPQFKCVRELACGILINRGTKAFAKDLIEGVQDTREKAKLLLESLYIDRHKIMDPDEMSSHLACLHEMGARVTSDPNTLPPFVDLCKIMPHAVNLSLHVLTSCSMHIFAPVVAKCVVLSELVLYGCSLDDAKLKILWESLKRSEHVMHVLNLASNCGIGPEGMREVAKTVCHCQVRELNLHSCELSAKHAITFLDQMKESLPEDTEVLKFKNLYLRSNSGLGSTGLEAVANVVEIVGLEKLDINRCNVNAKTLRNMMRFDLRSLQVLMLSVFDQGESRMVVVGDCVVQNDINELHINECRLKHCDLLDLENSLLKSEQPHCCLKSLNVSNNPLKSRECHATLNRIAKMCGTETMDVHKCEFSDQQIMTLKETVKEFLRMDTFRSVELGSDYLLYKLRRSREKYIDISLTNTNIEELSKLPDLLKQSGARLRRLCLPEGRVATSRDVEVFIDLLPYISEEMWVDEWTVEKSGRQQLEDGLRKLDESSKLEIYFATDDSISRPKEVLSQDSTAEPSVTG